MPFTIRAAVPEDAPCIVDLINALARYERLEDKSHPDEGQLRKQLREDASPRIEALVVHERGSGKCIGFALYFHNYSTFLTNFGLFLEDLYVDPVYRGQGIGLALFKNLARIATQRGCRRLDWNVLDWNETAKTFYDKLGATPQSDWVTMRLQENQLTELVS